MKPALVVLQTVDFTITFTCLISNTSSDFGLFLNMHLPLLLNNIDSAVIAEIQRHEFIVASLAYTVKPSKNVHMKKYKHQWLLTDTLSRILNSVFCSLDTISYNGADIIK